MNRVLVVASSLEDATPVMDNLRARGFEPELVQAPDGKLFDTLASHAREQPTVIVSTVRDRVVHDVRNTVLLPLTVQIDRVERALGRDDIDQALKLVGEMRTLLSAGEASLTGSRERT